VSVADFAVIGGGVVGLTVALELRARHPRARIVVLEKESSFGAHASGRNSGVLHAGFYYHSDSMKARLTREGNRRMVAWCEARGVAVRRTGKLVVARDDADDACLDELLRRGRANGVDVELVDAREARQIEPLAATYRRALWSPTTASVDPGAVMHALADDCRSAQVELLAGTHWLGVERAGACRTSGGTIDAGYWINAAGLHADRIAHAFGFGSRYAIVPFKGMYLEGDRTAPQLRTQVYPVPDMAMPFLGAHFTVAVDGHVKIGPTALPAFWREQYGSLASLDRFSAVDLLEVLGNQLRLLSSSAMVRRHSVREPRKLLRSRLVAEARGLVPSARVEQFRRWGSPGIRAQLVDRLGGELVMDFRYERDERSLHVLNAVSPAFTCAFPLAEQLVDAAFSRCGVPS
jgi:L-2-hydroxyglutarate oxidase LhgO